MGDIAAHYRKELDELEKWLIENKPPLSVVLAVRTRTYALKEALLWMKWGGGRDDG